MAARTHCAACLRFLSDTIVLRFTELHHGPSIEFAHQGWHRRRHRVYRRRAAAPAVAASPRGVDRHHVPQGRRIAGGRHVSQPARPREAGLLGARESLADRLRRGVLRDPAWRGHGAGGRTAGRRHPRHRPCRRFPPAGHGRVRALVQDSAYLPRHPGRLRLWPGRAQPRGHLQGAGDRQPGLLSHHGAAGPGSADRGRQATGRRPDPDRRLQVGRVGRRPQGRGGLAVLRGERQLQGLWRGRPPPSAGNRRPAREAGRRQGGADVRAAPGAHDPRHVLHAVRPHPAAGSRHRFPGAVRGPLCRRAVRRCHAGRQPAGNPFGARLQQPAHLGATAGRRRPAGHPRGPGQPGQGRVRPGRAERPCSHA
ncbi:Uncharacterised protein [Bordetella pertussis]|nr:Uncharacterised protein [Bordetella pertussis]